MALGLQDLKQPALRLRLIALDDPKAFAGGCIGFVVPFAGSWALPHHHLKAALLLCPIAHLSPINTDRDQTIRLLSQGSFVAG